MLLKTERHLNVRSSEHIDISHLTGRRVECKPSAVSDYLLLHNHDSDFDDFTILCRDNNGFRLKWLKTLHLFHYYYLIKLPDLLPVGFV